MLLSVTFLPCSVTSVSLDGFRGGAANEQLHSFLFGCLWRGRAGQGPGAGSVPDGLPWAGTLLQERVCGACPAGSSSFVCQACLGHAARSCCRNGVFATLYSNHVDISLGTCVAVGQNFQNFLVRLWVFFFSSKKMMSNPYEYGMYCQSKIKLV